jgi:aromatase
MSRAALTPVTERVHTTLIEAPADLVYQLIANVTWWPALFGPSLHVEHLWQEANAERFQIWATVNQEVKTWTSRRELDPGALTITFEQERSQAPIASMGGEWSFRTLGPNRCEVNLGHHFTAVDDDPQALAWISAALDRNSEAELDALRRIAESGHPPADVLFAFEDVVETSGSAADVYDYVQRGDLWAQRLPHVREVRMTEDADGVQTLTMLTETADGSTHSTSSTRLCLPGNRIVYKQHILPKLLTGHSGQWNCAESESGATITARHVVAVDPNAVTEVLGPDATLADAREFLRSALGGNSRTTLSFACAHAEELAGRKEQSR